jgi:hypothetical protein
MCTRRQAARKLMRRSALTQETKAECSRKKAAGEGGNPESAHLPGNGGDAGEKLQGLVAVQWERAGEEARTASPAANWT